MDGEFSVTEFYESIIELLEPSGNISEEEREWINKTIAWWN